MSDTMGKVIAFIPRAGQIATCSRCGEVLRVSDKTNENARLLKHAKEAKGYCPACAVTEWFWVMGCREIVSTADDLAHPHVQEQFARVMLAGGADMKPNEINWSKVIANWNLPFSDGKKSYDPNKPPPAPKRVRSKR